MTCHAGECVPVVCEPETTRCEQYKIQECTPNGAGWVTFDCPPGQSCRKGECAPIRNNLLVVFDTSGSMNDPVDCICPDVGCPAKPFPECEVAECPRTRIGLSKLVFRNLLHSNKIDAVNMVVTHFPMTVSAVNLGCEGGYYLGNYELTGDDFSHETQDGDWFDKALHEILSVPFPTSVDDNTLTLAGKWFDNLESIIKTQETCTWSSQCPGGFCSSGACWYHDNPELRGIGGTPLGKSIFYAGELYRKMLYVQGRLCGEDADCANENYYCVDGTCLDPFRHCRTNMILLLTDGQESSLETSFFNPRVQAKRLRYGLCCETTEDCFEDSECTPEQYCGLYPHPNSQDLSEPAVTEGPCRLEAYSGEPIKVYTHVIDLSSGSYGEDTNKQISDEGGGQYHHANDVDPDALLMQVFEVIDFKLNLFCVPDDGSG